MLSKFETDFIEILKARYEKYEKEYEGISWDQVLSAIKNSPSGLEILIKMEETGGEPGLLEYDKVSGKYIFCDMSKETPKDRVSLCYDNQALMARKKNPPRGDAGTLAKEIGIEIMDEAMYRRLQKLDEFDLKTSSWIKTPEKIRKLGGAIFCDRRYDTVFTYHNGAESYYASRGFRGYIGI